jgi:hypothetical protein
VHEHLAECNECTRLAQEWYDLLCEWPTWTAQQHGLAYWKERVCKVLVKVASKLQDGTIKSLLSTRSRQMAGEVADSPQEIGIFHISAMQWEWALATSPGMIRGASSGQFMGFQYQFAQPTPESDLTVTLTRIPGASPDLRPPIMVLVPSREDDPPQMVIPELLPGSDTVEICVPRANLPRGEFVVTFSPNCEQP